ncbi:helix-turn-helix domain-containing protein [uncultured Tateyamaria sp.]|nr:helix-turn-helix domain-containing protein [uncultured Tateyamaria sp.]
MQELRVRGSSMAQLARDLGVTQGSLSLISRGLHRSKRLEREIAAALNTTPEALFADRYPSETSK